MTCVSLANLPYPVGHLPYSAKVAGRRLQVLTDLK